MEYENGQWLMKGIDWDDPSCIHTSDELAKIINDIGFLPLFCNEVEGFSVEEMTDAVYWWSGDEKRDPWEWRAILARRDDIAYGKFFNKKVGFVSRKWFPYFANYRRDGYDFDARYEDGKAQYRENLIMQHLLPEGDKDLSEVNTKNIAEEYKEISSYELKKRAGFIKGGEKNFDGTIAKLQMQTYVTVRDFRQKKNKRGESYGWPIAVYTLPEYLWGYEYVTEKYNEKPQESLKKIIKNMKKHFPAAGEEDILRVVG